MSCIQLAKLNVVEFSAAPTCESNETVISSPCVAPRIPLETSPDVLAHPRRKGSNRSIATVWNAARKCGRIHAGTGMGMGTSKNPKIAKILIFNSLVPLRIPFRGKSKIGVNCGRVKTI